MQNKYFQNKAEEAKTYAGSHNAKRVFGFLKTVFGPSRFSCAPLLSLNVTTLEGMNLLNRPLRVDPILQSQITQQLDFKCKERKTFCRQIQAKHEESVLFLLGYAKKQVPTLLKTFLISCVWEKMTADFCDALIVSLYKDDGNKADWKRQRHLNPLHSWKDLGMNHFQHSSQSRRGSSQNQLRYDIYRKETKKSAIKYTLY